MTQKKLEAINLGNGPHARELIEETLDMGAEKLKHHIILGHLEVALAISICRRNPLANLLSMRIRWYAGLLCNGILFGWSLSGMALVLLREEAHQRYLSTISIANAASRTVFSRSNIWEEGSDKWRHAKPLPCDRVWRSVLQTTSCSEVRLVPKCFVPRRKDGKKENKNSFVCALSLSSTTAKDMHGSPSSPL